MAQTFNQLQQQIQSLQAQAEKLRQREVEGVIERIREAITTYGISQQDLFGQTAGRAAGRANGDARPSAVRAKFKSKAKDKSAKYGDDNGNTWVGLGKRPRWLQEALSSGRSLEEFLIAGGQNGGSAGAGDGQLKNTASANGARKGGPGKASKALYRDDAGNSWSGRGPRPRWLKEAIASGKPLEALRA
jgi:DNA-binding protein H-NS